jgi:hypothetical protein
MASAVLSAACSSQERIGLPTLLMLPQTLPCAITPSEPLLPPIVADATGGDPAWVVTGAGALQWTAAGMKTLWIFKTRNRVHVIGHEVNTGATLRFQRHGLDGPIENDMTIDNPRRESVLPGGASLTCWTLIRSSRRMSSIRTRAVTSSTSTSSGARDTSLFR